MKLADKGSRVGNLIIDTIVLSILILILSLLMYIFFPETAESDSQAFNILFSTVFFSYYFFLEYFLGKTIGKMLTKTIVVDRHGNKPNLFKLIIRTLLRFVLIEILSFLFGSGLHDQLSLTRVVELDKMEINA